MKDIPSTSPNETKYIDHFYVFLEDLKSKGPEYRVLYIPQNLLVSLYEGLQETKIHTTDIHNALYLFELNKHFETIGQEKSNTILDELEKTNKVEITQYHLKLQRFINQIQEEIMAGDKDEFHIPIIPNETLKSLKRKLRTKEESIGNYIRKQGHLFNIHTNKSRNVRDVVSIQINDMIAISFLYIIEDEGFLNKVLHKNIGKISNTVIMLLLGRDMSCITDSKQ